MTFRHLNDQASKGWVDSLLDAKDMAARVAAQKAFLSALLNFDGKQFVSFVEESIAKFAIEGDGPYVGKDIPHQITRPDDERSVSLTPGHMHMMPPTDVLPFHEYWGDIGRRDASCPTFWGSTTLAAIDSGYIMEPIWLCVDRNGNDSYARSRLDKALREASSVGWDSSEQQRSGHDIGIDGLTRRALRLMMAPMRLRGAPALYASCSLAKAWWCGWFAEQCSTAANHFSFKLDKQSAVVALQWMWNELADAMVGHLPILREQAVLAAIAVWAWGELDAPTNSGLRQKDAVVVFKLLGRISESRSLGLMNSTTILCDIIKEELPNMTSRRKA